VRVREYSHNLIDGLLEKSQLVQPAYQEGYRVDWDDARILEIESNSRYRKYNKSAIWHVYPIRSFNPGWDISPMWISLFSNKVISSQGRSE
jgi:hypothetical protein